MRFITMATHSERMLPILLESAKKHDIKLEVFGQGTKWINYGNKLYQLTEYIKNFNDNEIIAFFDAFDSIILTNEEEFIVQYHLYNKKITDENKKDLVFSNGRNFLKIGRKILLETNSGLFMGRAQKMKWLFNKISKDYDLNKNGSCDVILERYRKYFTVDNDYELFYNYYFDGKLQKIMTLQKHKKNVIVNNKRVFINEKIKTKPLAIHFPKNSMNKEIISELGYEYNVKIDNGICYLLRDYWNHYHQYVFFYIIKTFFFYLIILYIYNLLN